MPNKSQYRNIVYFDSVRRHGSIREAARHLGLAASAVNRQLLNLEQELGLQLFDRLPGGMSLTAAGEAMARHAIAVLQDERRVLSDFDDLRGLRRGEISIIAAESLTASFLPEVIGRMQARYPGIVVRLRIAGSNDIPAALLRGEADLGLAFSLPRHRDLQQLAVAKFRLGALIRPDHRLASEATDGQVSFATCARHRLIIPSRDLSIFSVLEPQLRKLEGRMQIAAESNSVALMKNLVLQLNAVAFQSRVGIEAELAAGTLQHLPLTGRGPMVTELGAYLRQGRSLPVALDVFAALVRDRLAAYEAEG